MDKLKIVFVIEEISSYLKEYADAPYVSVFHEQNKDFFVMVDYGKYQSFDGYTAAKVFARALNKHSRVRSVRIEEIPYKDWDFNPQEGIEFEILRHIYKVWFIWEEDK